MKDYKEINWRKLKITLMAKNHWGDFHFLPDIELSITYQVPTFIFQWMIFRMDILIHKRLPDWFMDYVWSVMNFDFLFKEEDDEKE